MSYTLAFQSINNNCGKVTEEWRWPLREEYIFLVPFDGPAHGRCYSLEYDGENWDIVGHPDFMWDFATKWFDPDHIKEGSLGHDILHLLIKRGHISELDNDTIDREFRNILVERGNCNKFLAGLYRRGTNIADQYTTFTDGRETVYLNRGKRL